MVRIAAVSVMVIAAWAAGTPVQVSFTPDQTGTVSAPVVGLGATSEDYLLTERTVWSILAKEFDGNNQEIPQFANTSASKDAASFDGHTLSFHAYDFAADTVEDLGTLDFDASQYGTPTGLDFVLYKGSARMLVATRDKQGSWGSVYNFVLDMTAMTGAIDQYFTTPGLGNKLQDILYEDGKIALGCDRAGSGLIDVGAYTPYHPYDFDGDGRIDTADVALLASGWLSPRTALYRGPVPEGLADDGVVNLEDWAALARYWEGNF